MIYIAFFSFVQITCGNNRSQEQIVYRWSDEIPPTCIPWCNYVRMDLISDYFRSYNFTVRGFKVHYQASTKGRLPTYVRSINSFD